MSTTPTTEQQFFNKVVKAFDNAQEQAHSLSKDRIIPYNMMVINGIHDAILGLVCLNNTEKYNAISSVMYRKLSKKFRYSIKREVDAITDFEVSLLPGEKIENATLYMRINLPIDEELMDLVINDKELSDDRVMMARLRKSIKDDTYFSTLNDWSSYKELYTTHYVPVKTVSNINGSFSFYQSMYMISPYTSLSLGLDISNVRDGRNIDLKIGIQMLPDDLRKEITNVTIPDNLKVSYGGFKIVN